MGYHIFSFGIKTNTILGAFGSKNPKLQVVVENNDIFKNYANFEVEGSKTNPKKALIDIIQGNVYDSNSSYSYGYALIGLCAALGSTPPYNQEIKLGYDTDLINSVLEDDFELNNFNIEDTFFPEKKHPFPIPKIVDFPIIGLIKHTELINISKKLSALNITQENIDELQDDPDEREFAYEHLKGILENVNFCLKNNLDLVSFCH